MTGPVDPQQKRAPARWELSFDSLWPGINSPSPSPAAVAIDDAGGEGRATARPSQPLPSISWVFLFLKMINGEGYLVPAYGL